MSKKKVLACGLVLALSAAMYINWYYTKPADKRKAPIVKAEVTEQENLGEAKYVSAEGKKADFFDEANLKRSKAHAEAQAVLQKQADDRQADAEARKAAAENLKKLSDNIKAETDIENLIQGKIGTKSVVTIGDTVEVLVEKGKLNTDSVLQIKEIIVNKTKISSEKITLVEVK